MFPLQRHTVHGDLRCRKTVQAEPAGCLQNIGLFISLLVMSHKVLRKLLAGACSLLKILSNFMELWIFCVGWLLLSVFVTLSDPVGIL
ncbi:hypothetical protein [Sneathiella aquimaris]|uniref:hypothetical protein n=1 Tax=Sneathiella aquimaris TaxID=2599305 RepID=UPI00146E6B65|nr:hypothetical protein [Sneathiella aquimaris]